MIDLELQDVHVLVTGASGGIGLETANLFLEQGAKVTAHYNTTSSTLSPLISQFGSSKVQAIQANLCSEPEVSRLFSTAVQSFGPVQVVMNNHGIWPTNDAPLASMSLDQWRKTIDTNLTSSFLVVREYLSGLKQESVTEEQKAKAAFVFIGSSAGKVGEALHADYATSKSALFGLMLSMKNEIVKIAPKGRVNIISPGWVKTTMAEEALKDPMVVYRALATTPLKKVGLPYDVATQIVFLSSNKVSGHVTGEILNVNGGLEGNFLNLEMIEKISDGPLIF
ncbi:NAD-P-binding protein [Dendrothele bispora CBS 962.96]|uniref:NAD-P-binding protein n=1 Tax=Dendrothele bispora (strain CBS 962.96) TaxID=1314807 RepID=A0A4S8MHP4_DENBC|nr:NAD-P-binding protein [Dendrothele bispora CBS 962.96]